MSLRYRLREKHEEVAEIPWDASQKYFVNRLMDKASIKRNLGTPEIYIHYYGKVVTDWLATAV
jgi:hypothetical protein